MVAADTHNACTIRTPELNCNQGVFLTKLGCFCCALLHRGEPDLAILATKEAGLDLKLFAVDASFDPQGQFNKIAKIEEKYESHKSGLAEADRPLFYTRSLRDCSRTRLVLQRSYVHWPVVGRYENEHALTRDEVELYGLWLESHARYDEALGLYNLHEAHLPNERLLAGLASLRDPTMMITTQDTQSLPTVRHGLAYLLLTSQQACRGLICHALADQRFRERRPTHPTQHCPRTRLARSQPSIECSRLISSTRSS